MSKDGQRERLERIPASLLRISEHIDVVTFAEADIKDERESMLAQFRKTGFVYATSILHDPDPFTRCVVRRLRVHPRRNTKLERCQHASDAVCSTAA